MLMVPEPISQSTALWDSSYNHSTPSAMGGGHYAEAQLTVVEQHKFFIVAQVASSSICNSHTWRDSVLLIQNTVPSSA